MLLTVPLPVRDQAPVLVRLCDSVAVAETVETVARLQLAVTVDRDWVKCDGEGLLVSLVLWDRMLRVAEPVDGE